MKLTSKVVGFIAAALISLGVAMPSMAAESTSPTFTITPGGQFSVEVTGGNFPNAVFTLGIQDSSTVSSAAYRIHVTDLRGTGAGWTVSLGASNFTNTVSNAIVPGASLASTNNTQWDSAIPNYATSGGSSNTSGFTKGTTSVGTGVSALTAGGFGINLITTPRIVLQSAAGISGVTPNGTGHFYDSEALYLTFPAAVAAGTYTSTVTATLAATGP